MSNLFKVKTPKPDPRIAELQEKQEKRLEAEETSRRKQIAARGRASRTGGLRSLLSPMREEAQAGLNPLNKDI